MKYYPSIILLTKENPSVELVLEGESSSKSLSVNATLVTVTAKGETLRDERCSLVLLESFSKKSSTADKVTFQITMTDEISTKLKSCIVEKDQYLAIRLEVPVTDKKSAVTSKVQALVPLFDTTQNNILTKSRTAEVLGTLQNNLRIINFTCDKQLLFTAQDVHCSGNILNTTETPVTTHIVTYARELLPPAYTIYENLERTNLLLLPGQNQSFSLVIPKEKIPTVGTDITVVSTFAALGNDTATFTTSKEQQIFFFPPALIMLVISVILIISAILYRIKKHKFTASPDGSSNHKEKSYRSS